MRYVRTSGDQDRSDGVRGAYDTFYMAVAQMSALGLMRASNLHAISIGGTHALRPKTTFIWRVHDSHATTLKRRLVLEQLYQAGRRHVIAARE
jgi:hypothetical protein